MRRATPQPNVPGVYIHSLQPYDNLKAVAVMTQVRGTETSLLSHLREATQLNLEKLLSELDPTTSSLCFLFARAGRTEKHPPPPLGRTHQTEKKQGQFLASEWHTSLSPVCFTF